MAFERAIPRILIVEDEENIRHLVGSALELAGFETSGTASGRDALDLVATWQPEAIVLDIMLPDLDGFSVLQRIRDRGFKVPVVFLTARDTSDDRVRGLRDGGDDYVVKPFDIAELVARIELRVKRSGEGAAGRRLRCADLQMDVEARQVTRAGQEIHLSPTEFNLLQTLLVNHGRILSRSHILDRVWSYDFDGDPAVVDTYMFYLRKKVDFVEPKLIHTVRGVGFVLRADS